MPPKKKSSNGYKFAEPLPKGMIIENPSVKKQWKLGPSIGKGGFGEIYSAQEVGMKADEYPFVLKIEPHANGPLFVEQNFYIRNAKADDVEQFKTERKLNTFGMPVYHGFGSHEYNGEKYRFLVLDKFSTDLYKLYLENNKVFPANTVFKIAVQLTDVLEYIHQRGYVHADIKAANIMLGGTKQTDNKQVYLLDYGLASKYSTDGAFKPNPKKAHDGTIEFLSRDAHQGVQTRRGDLEILAYNLIQWLGCTLPWEKCLSDPKVVQKSKEEHMCSIPKMLKACFGNKAYPKQIADYLQYLETLDFNSQPDYKKIRHIFTSGVTQGGDLFAQIKTPKRSLTSNGQGSGKKSKSASVSPSNGAMPKRRVQNTSSIDDLQSDDTPEEEKVAVVKTKPRKRRALIRMKTPVKRRSKSKDSLDGYTPAMKEVMLRKLARDGAKKKPASAAHVSAEGGMNGYTDEMKAIAKKKAAKKN